MVEHNMSVVASIADTITVLARGATLAEGHLPDGTFRFHSGDQDLGAMCMLGTFSERAVLSRNSVVKIDDDIPLDKAALVGCGVPTGWGSAVYTADVHPGDTVVVFGVGGIGINAVQGAKHAGARYVIAVDPIEFKRTKALEFGATHAVATGAEAIELAPAITRRPAADELTLIGLEVAPYCVHRSPVATIRESAGSTAGPSP